MTSKSVEAVRSLQACSDLTDGERGGPRSTEPISYFLRRLEGSRSRATL